MQYVAIQGASAHSAADQTLVDRAAGILGEEFGEYASPDDVREHLHMPEDVLLTNSDAIAVVPRVEQRGRSSGSCGSRRLHVGRALEARC